MFLEESFYSRSVPFQTVCCSVYPTILTRQRLSKNVSAATRIVGGVVFYAVRVVSKKFRQLVLTSGKQYVSIKIFNTFGRRVAGQDFRNMHSLHYDMLVLLMTVN